MWRSAPWALRMRYATLSNTAPPPPTLQLVTLLSKYADAVNECVLHLHATQRCQPIPPAVKAVQAVPAAGYEVHRLGVQEGLGQGGAEGSRREGVVGVQGL